MILHLVTKAEWDAKPEGQPYLPDAFAKDGFIHCTQGDALALEVANRFYKAVPGDFLVVGIDETKVTSPVKWEAPADPTQAVPSVDSASQPAPATATIKPVDLPPEVQAEVGSQASELPGTSAAPAAASGAEVKPAPVRFPHIYGPLNRDAIMGVRRVLRSAGGAFTGFAPLEISPAQPAPPQTRLKTPSELANELVETTGDFSEALARYKDKIEAHMDELDKNIKDL
ncbi:MAG TPA: DUF952 domain-containing protein [Anaerolineae bacterium]